MPSLSIRTKILSGSAALLALMAITSASAYWALRSVTGQAVEVLSGDAEISDYAQLARAHVLGMRRFEKDLFLNIDSAEERAEYLKKWTDQRDRLVRRIDDLEPLVTEPDDRRALAAARKELAAYEAGFGRVLQDIDGGAIRTPQAANAAITPSNDSIHSLEVAVASMAADAVQRIDDHGDRLEKRAARTGRTIAIVCLAAAAIGVAVSVLLAQRMTRPILEVVEVARQVARGELPERVSVRSRDEIGALTESVNEMTGYLAGMARAAEAIAAGDLRVKVWPKSPGDVLGHAFAGMGAYLASMAEAAEAIARGDVMADVAPRSNQDLLGTAFGEMTAYLRDMVRAAEAVAQGDLRADVAARSQRDALGTAFRQMVDGLRGLVGQVRQGARHVARASGEIAAASDHAAKSAGAASSAIEELTATMHELSAKVREVAGSAEGQAATATQTSAAVEQMVASIQRVSRNGEQLVELARHSGEAVLAGREAVTRSEGAVRAGRDAVGRSAEGMARISTAIETAAGTIEALGGRAQEIGRIVGIIEEIADRTNLLALNAAIIAAQAGDQGRSFAVVAGEVRTLAERCAASTKEIAGLIGAIQREAAAAVANMRASRETVAHGMTLGEDVAAALGRIDEVAADVDAAFGRIDEAVSEVTRRSQEIGVATREQAAGAAQVAGEMERLTTVTRQIHVATRDQAAGAGQVARVAEQMRSATEQHASSAEESRLSAGQLASSAETLQAAVARFQLRGAEDGAVEKTAAARRVTQAGPVAGNGTKTRAGELARRGDGGH